MTAPAPVKSAAVALVATAALIDTHVAALRPLLAQLDAQEAALRSAMATHRWPLHDHLAGRARLSETARHRLANGTPGGLQEASPASLASIISAAFARELL
jgi:hypothetical protein